MARDMAESRERVKNSNLWTKLLNKVRDLARPHIEMRDEKVALKPEGVPPERTYDSAYDS